jgi:amino acid permease
MNPDLKKVIYTIATLSGTIIGVGIFSLPYITSKVGFLMVAGYFLVLGTLIVFVHLFLGELALETPDFKRLPGFAKFHLGSFGEKIALLSAIVGTFGAILAYLVVGGQFLSELLSPSFGHSILFWTLVYFFVGAVLIFFDIRPIAVVELFSLILFFLVLIFLFFQGRNLIRIENLFPKPDFSQWFLPYGPILFSLWGAALVPEIEEMLKGKKEYLKKTILLSVLIPVFVYLFFIYLVLGISGPQTTESALGGLKNFLDEKTISLLLFFGILTTFTSFITLALTLKKIFWYDLKIEKNLSFFLASFIPLFLFLFGFNRFISIISFVGGIALGTDGILILLMYKKRKPKAKIIYPLILIFLFGIFYEIIYLPK